MEIIFPAPQFLLWVVIGVFVFSAPAVLLKKGKWLIKGIVLLLITLVCGLLLFFFYRDTRFAVNEQGFYSNNYGEFSVKWEEVEKAFIIDDLKNSEYKPAIRTNGYAMGEVGFGWFALKNGKNARVVLQTRSRCLVVETADVTYLFGPRDFDSFIRVVEEYIRLIPYEEISND